MKNILIPSDFSVQSLHCIKPLFHKLRHERLNLLLVHVFMLSDSISELMLLSRRQKEYDFISNEFWQACKELEQEFNTQIQSIQVECFYGSTVAVFKNFLEGRNIDLIVYPAHYQYRKLSKRSLDPAKLIERCGREVLVLTPDTANKASEFYPLVQSLTYNLSLN